MSIQVNEFRYIPGKNDAEYIKLLKEALERQKQITSKAIAKIKELSNCSEFPNNWIPCSERLPDVAQRVLLSGHGEVMIGRLHSFGKYSLEPTGISYIYPKGGVEAWMPLPPAYKGDE